MSQDGPMMLDGIRILDLAIMTAGPVGTMLLGDLGADVIKVEAPGEGDHSRHLGTVFLDGESSQFLSANRNKRSLALNLRHPRGKEVFFRIAQESDVICENFRPGTVDRLGVGYEAVRAVKPDIIYVSISAFGQTGPYAHRPANDPIVQALSGLMAMTGEKDGPPLRIGNPYPDFGGAMLLAYAVCAALFHRERTREGQKVEISLLDGALFSTIPREGETLATGAAPARLGSAHPSFVPYQNLEAKDGRYVFLSCFTEKFWSNLCGALGRPEWRDDPRFRTNPDRCRNRGELLPMLEAIFRERTAEEWVKLLEEAEVPCIAVNDLHQALREDPQVAHNQMIVTLEHPKVGKVETLAHPVRFQKTPATYRKLPPLLGQHNEEILGEFGYSRQEVEALRAEGVI